jgi:hypothetical protein
MRRTACLAMLLGLSCVARAQDSTQVQETNVSQAIGLHYGTPLRASLSAGLLIDRNRRQNDGTILMLEQGFEGSEFSMGYYHMFSWFGSGFSVRGAVLRTGEEPWNASPHTTYVGAEVHTMFAMGVGGRVGFFRRASRSVSNPEDNVLSMGVSIGH